jgi:hypothetical protein
MAGTLPAREMPHKSALGLCVDLGAGKHRQGLDDVGVLQGLAANDSGGEDVLDLRFNAGVHKFTLRDSSQVGSMFDKVRNIRVVTVAFVALCIFAHTPTLASPCAVDNAECVPQLLSVFDWF